VVVHERSRVAFNGGPGGINRRPSRDDERFMHERHFEATHNQVEHENGARGNREFLASVNHGRPAIAATSRPGEFRGRNAVATRPVADHRMDNRADHRVDNRPVDRRAENRPVDNRADRGVPRPQGQGREVNRPQNNGHNMDRPQNNGRNMDRPMPHENANNRGGEARNNVRPAPAPRSENRGAAPRQESHPHENAPHPQKDSRGPKGR